MSETPSAMIPLGTQMPPFSLPDACGTEWSQPHGNAGYLVVFMCNQCPFVIHVAHTLNAIAQRCKEVDVQMIGINSNDTSVYLDDAPEMMIETAKEFGWEFPYLVDETQEVAKAFQATCTPDVFLYDKGKQLYYRGQFDDSRPSVGSSDGSDLLAAINRLHSDKKPPDGQKPSIGCNIKWKY
ncbi:MAG: thioredoxin family protein [Phycisphaerales bacterium]|jgi:peroxiredoxin|nr:thioredoxin family protein [Phycisphaerales bacterium]